MRIDWFVKVVRHAVHLEFSSLQTLVGACLRVHTISTKPNAGARYLYRNIADPRISRAPFV